MQLNVTNLQSGLTALPELQSATRPTSSKDLDTPAGSSPGIYQVPFTKDYEDIGLYREHSGGELKALVHQSCIVRKKNPIKYNVYAIVRHNIQCVQVSNFRISSSSPTLAPISRYFSLSTKCSSHKSFLVTLPILGVLQMESQSSSFKTGPCTHHDVKVIWVVALFH